MNEEKEVVEEQMEQVAEKPVKGLQVKNPKGKLRWKSRKRLGLCGKKMKKKGCERRKKNDKCPDKECRGQKK